MPKTIKVEPDWAFYLDTENEQEVAICTGAAMGRQVAMGVIDEATAMLRIGMILAIEQDSDHWSNVLADDALRAYHISANRKAGY